MVQPCWFIRYWLENRERERVVQHAEEHPAEDYRRLRFMMLDKDIVAVSPSSVYRALEKAGMLRKWNKKRRRNGKEFQEVYPVGWNEPCDKRDCVKNDMLTGR